MSTSFATLRGESARTRAQDGRLEGESRSDGHSIPAPTYQAAKNRPSEGWWDRMVYLKDEGSEFESPIDSAWKYIFGGEAHDGAHTTTRKPTFKRVSDITIEHGTERLLRGKWAPDLMRITLVPPVSVTTEWLEGALAGSKFV